MNHDLAVQPPHLDGKWVFVSANSRGGHPICGCTPGDAGEGHETREEAERHFYETCLAEMTLERAVRETTSAHRCKVCEVWTPKFIGSNHFGSWFGMQMIFLCDAHLPADDEALRTVLREHVPFEPGYESWHS